MVITLASMSPRPLFVLAAALGRPSLSALSSLMSGMSGVPDCSPYRIDDSGHCGSSSEECCQPLSSLSTCRFTWIEECCKRRWPAEVRPFPSEYANKENRRQYPSPACDLATQTLHAWEAITRQCPTYQPENEKRVVSYAARSRFSDRRDSQWNDHQC